MELSGVIEKDRWVCEWNFPVFHREGSLGLRVGLSGVIEKDSWILSGTCRCHRKEWLGVRVEHSGYHSKGSLALRVELSGII